MPPATGALIAVNLAFFVQQAFAPALMLKLALWPIGGAWLMLPQAGFEPWQVVTYGFLHASGTHLAFNMLGLYMFGGPIERTLGAKRFLLYYFACVISAAATQLFVLGLAGAFVPTVGASGGVFGLLLAYAVLFPHHRVMLLFPPIPMRARVFVVLYAGIELALGLFASATGVAHFAHLGGMIGGYLLLRHWKVRAVA